MKLSVIIPVYNERQTIREILKRVTSLQLNHGLEKEIIVIDDGSDDGTGEILSELKDFLLIRHSLNQGKGASIRDGLQKSNGDFVIIQDADLEYDPADINSLILPLINDRADVVYGSRFLGKTVRPRMYSTHYWGNRILTFVSNFFTGLKLTDMETGYKAFSRKVVDVIKNNLVSDRFDIEPEITARIKKFRVLEVSIYYEGRTVEESKKIGWRDGFMAIWSILRFNLRVNQ